MNSSLAKARFGSQSVGVLRLGLNHMLDSIRDHDELSNVRDDTKGIASFTEATFHSHNTGFAGGTRTLCQHVCMRLQHIFAYSRSSSS